MVYLGCWVPLANLLNLDDRLSKVVNTCPLLSTDYLNTYEIQRLLKFRLEDGWVVINSYVVKALRVNLSQAEL